jgi:pimeloyl-ACP methyl ester carboxylesterase
LKYPPDVSDPSAILGAAAFLGTSGALLWAGAVAGVAREALRPERRGIGWALARGFPTEPTAWGLPAHEWEFEFDGTRCPVFEIGPADPSLPTMIVLHGFARSRYDALARLGPLLPHARRFILPDLPGHGDALGRTTRLGTDEDRFVAALAARCATGPILLAGHSLGATIAIHAAALPELAPRTKGVLALAPYERLRTPLGARLELRAMPRRPLLGATLTTLAAFGIRERSTRASAARTTCPVAVVAGALDPVTPIEEARAIASAARDARFASVDRARHDDFDTLGRGEIEASMAWLAART